MDAPFNLDVDAYSMDELKRLLTLRDKYSPEQVEAARTKLAKQLDKNHSLGAERRRNILFFLDVASEKLINASHPDKPGPYTGTWAERIIPSVEVGGNVLITNPNERAGKTARVTEGRQATTGEAPPGWLNPINVRTLMQGINIDTRFRPDYYKTRSTDFTMILPEAQKKVISMRVAAIEIPMTYYAISASFGNNTMLIMASEGAQTKFAQAPAPPQIDFKPKLPLPYDKDKYQTAWRLRLPDGNYELSWSDKSLAMPIEAAMNDAIAAARPGLVDSVGNFYLWEGDYISDAAYRLLPNQDLCFAVNRINGRASFGMPMLTPPIDSTGDSEPKETGPNKKFVRYLRFNVNDYGSLDMDTNIQFRLGWSLGFRAAQYAMGDAKVWETVTVPTVPTVSAVSEGICYPCGPRYCFLAIDDHQKNAGPSYLAAFSQSTMGNNIITRINLSAVQEDDGVYKSSNDPGLSSQMNRTREYFGPVDIQRLSIKVFDEFGRIIDLNNMDWSFTLAFEKLYD